VIFSIATIGGAAGTAAVNTRDFFGPSWLVASGVALRSATQVSNYLVAGGQGTSKVMILDSAGWYDSTSDYGIHPGRITAWTQGGYAKSEDWVVGTHGTPPTTLAYVHKHTFQTAAPQTAPYTNFIEIPLLGRANKTIRLTVYMKKTANAFTVMPSAKICDPAYPFEHASEAVATALMNDTDNTAYGPDAAPGAGLGWQILNLTYTPDHDMALVLRVSGRNASGNLYWNYEYDMPSRSKRGALR
jgi:hypothetical protein